MAASLAAFISGCSSDTPIAITQVDHGVRFEVTQGEGSRLCPLMVEVAPWDETCATTPIWSVSAIDPQTDARNCVDRLVYGEVPQGFRQGTKAAKLIKGRLYRVRVDLTGREGLKLFALGDRDGPIDQALR